MVWRDTDVQVKVKLDMGAEPPCEICTHMADSCILMVLFLTNSACSSFISHSFPYMIVHSLVEAGTLIMSSALMVM